MSAMKIPFSVYDFFAYLSSGFVLLVGLDYGIGPGLMPRRTHRLH